MNFWDTVGGHRFTEGTVPSLVDAINRLADVVEDSNQLERKKLALMEEFMAKNEESANEKMFK